MDVFYHVIFIEKRKKCKIEFCYMRNHKSFVLGDISINYKTHASEISFSDNCKGILREDERQFILNRILKNLHIKV